MCSRYKQFTYTLNLSRFSYDCSLRGQMTVRIKSEETKIFASLISVFNTANTKLKSLFMDLYRGSEKNILYLVNSRIYRCTGVKWIPGAEMNMRPCLDVLKVYFIHKYLAAIYNCTQDISYSLNHPIWKDFDRIAHCMAKSPSGAKVKRQSVLRSLKVYLTLQTLCPKYP